MDNPTLTKEQIEAWRVSPALTLGYAGSGNANSMTVEDFEALCSLALQAEAMREALRFYAAKQNYREPTIAEARKTHEFATMEISFDGVHAKAKAGHTVPEVIIDTGALARAALNSGDAG